MRVYTYSQARKQLASVLDDAAREGMVQIQRRDGRRFAVRPIPSAKSPLDVPGIATDITTAELIEIIREGREREYPYQSPPAKRTRTKTG